MAEPGLSLTERLVKPGNLDGPTGPSADLGRRRQVRRVEAAAGLGVDERQGPADLIANPHRDHDDAAHPDLPQDPKVILVAGRRDEQLVGDMRVEFGLPGADHVGRTRRGVGVDGVVGSKLPPPAHFVGVGVSDGDGVDGAVRIEEVDRAPVGEAGDAEPGDLIERGLVVEGLLDERPRLGEVLGPHLALLPVVDVEARADIAEERAVGGEPGRAPVEDPPVLLVVEAEPVLHLERLLAVEMRGVHVDAPVEVVGVDALGPSATEFLLQRPPGEREPGGVEVRAPLVQPGHPHEHRGRVGHGPEAALALEQRHLDLLPLGDLALSRLVEPGVVDGDGGLSGDAGHEALDVFGKDARAFVPEEEPAVDLPRARDHGNGEVAPDGQVPRRHPGVGGVLPVPRVGRDVVRADDSLAPEGGTEDAGHPRHGEALERLAGRSGQRVERVRLPGLVVDVVEEGPELGRSQFRCGVGRSLHEGAEVELARERRVGLAEAHERFLLLAQR